MPRFCKAATTIPETEAVPPVTCAVVGLAASRKVAALVLNPSGVVNTTAEPVAAAGPPAEIASGSAFPPTTITLVTALMRCRANATFAET